MVSHDIESTIQYGHILHLRRAPCFAGQEYQNSTVGKRFLGGGEMLDTFADDVLSIYGAGVSGGFPGGIVLALGVSLVLKRYSMIGTGFLMLDSGRWRSRAA